MLCFADSASLHAATRRKMPICVFLELKMPHKSGLELLRELRYMNYPTPVFIVAKDGDIPAAVESIRAGAFDFFRKPLQSNDVISRVNDAAKLRESKSPSYVQSCFKSQLTSRETEVLELCVLGHSSKEASLKLGISHRTVEDYRSRIMQKLGAKSATHLVRLVLAAH
jgi:FixJ family two-component response regulator